MEEPGELLLIGEIDGKQVGNCSVMSMGSFKRYAHRCEIAVALYLSLIHIFLATGGKRKAPQIPGLKEFEGRGVSYCAVCDAFFYRGKDVAVLGNSDFAPVSYTHLHR